MRLLSRALIILAAAALLGGLLAMGVLIGGGRVLPRERGIEPPAADSNGLVRLSPGGSAIRGLDFGSAAANWFGLESALGNLLIVGWVTLAGVVALRWIKGRRRGDGPG